MSLNPSNLIAARTNPGKTMFPNLARHVEPENALQTFLEVDGRVLAELAEAGIEPVGVSRRISNGSYKEVPTVLDGQSNYWEFQRAWYYWIATGRPGIPFEVAEEFWKEWGTQARAYGHCACPAPSEFSPGRPVDSYHIDTAEGLAAFVRLIAGRL
jgi:hypothetical protein